MNEIQKPDYNEFSDSRQVALYDAFNSLGADEEFFCGEVTKLSPSLVVDLGCGTGLLTCELTRRGFNIIGIEPASEMLNLARQKPYADKVRWIEGSHEKLHGLNADLVLMTSHVAQFFLEDEDWEEMLKSAQNGLTSSGRLIFDSKNPLIKPWEKWSRKTSTKKVGQVERWYELTKVEGSRVRYEIHYLLESGEELISNNELVYRSEEEITKSLLDAGFSVESVYGDWDGSPFDATSPEMIFVAVRE